MTKPTPILPLTVTSEDMPRTSTSEGQIANDAPSALAYLRRAGALDLADALGIGGAA